MGQEDALSFLLRAIGKDLTLEVDVEDKWSPIGETSSTGAIKIGALISHT